MVLWGVLSWCAHPPPLPCKGVGDGVMATLGQDGVVSGGYQGGVGTPQIRYQSFHPWETPKGALPNTLLDASI